MTKTMMSMSPTDMIYLRPAICLCVFEAADVILNLAFDLVGLAVRFQLGVTDCLARRLFDCAFEFLCRSSDPVLVHGLFLQSEQPPGREGCAMMPFNPHHWCLKLR